MDAFFIILLTVGTWCGVWAIAFWIGYLVEQHKEP